MKLVTAIIKPTQFDEVYAALDELGVAGMTATEVRGMGRERCTTEIYRGAAYTHSFRTRIKIEVAVEEHQLEPVIGVIRSAVGSGTEGSVFVSPLDQAIRMQPPAVQAAA